MANPRVVYRGGQVCRCRTICGMCRAPRTRRAPAPDASPSEFCKRATCHGHALDRRGSPGTSASPRRVCACMLAPRDLSAAQQTRRVCASAALAPCSPPVATAAFQVATNAAHRVTSGGRGPCMMAAFTASRHFMATLGAHARRLPLATDVALCLCPQIRCSRTAHEPST